MTFSASNFSSIFDPVFSLFWDPFGCEKGSQNRPRDRLGAKTSTFDFEQHSNENTFFLLRGVPRNTPRSEGDYATCQPPEEDLGCYMWRRGLRHMPASRAVVVATPLTHTHTQHTHTHKHTNTTHTSRGGPGISAHALGRRTSVPRYNAARQLVCAGINNNNNNNNDNEATGITPHASLQRRTWD